MIQPPPLNESLDKTAVRGRDRRIKQPGQGSTTLIVLCGAVAIFLALIWALNLEARLPSLRIAEQPPTGIAQRILEPGSYQADNSAISRSGNWFTQTLGSSSASTSSASMVTSTPGSAMTFRFYGTDLSMNARIGPESGKAHISIDGDESSVLPSDTSGSFVDLGSDQAEEESILIATGLAHRDHTVVITFAGTADLAISGFTVTSSTPFPWAFTILYVGLACALFVLLRMTVLLVSRDRGWLR